MKQKLLTVLLIAIMAISLSACGDNTPPNTPIEKKDVVEKTQEPEAISTTYTKDDFIKAFEGIWVSMNSTTSVSFEFLSISDGKVWSGVHGGGGGSRIGTIEDVTHDGEIYDVKLFYKEEIDMGDFYEAETINWRIQISDNCLTTITDGGGVKNNTSWVYKGNTLNDAVSNMQEHLKPKETPANKSSSAQEYSKYPNGYSSEKTKTNLRIGMTKNQVKIAWGDPLDIDKVHSDRGVRETWWYKDNGNTVSVSFDYNGKVESIVE